MSKTRIIRSRDLPEEDSKIAFNAGRALQSSERRPKGGVLWLSGEGSAAGPASRYEKEHGQARDIVAAARAEAEAIQKQAYHDGFAQGEAAGRKLAAQKIEPVLRSLTALFEALGEERKALIARYESEIVKIAFLIATQVLHREIETSRDALLDVAKAAMEKMVKAERIEIRVSPYDLEMLQQQMIDHEARPEWLPSNVELSPDPQIGRGGCKLLADTGEIDATIETQLRLIKTVLWDE